MFTVALIGPDGAGKTTIINRIGCIESLPVKRIYMGVMLESGNVVLPTTRLILRMRETRSHRQGKAASFVNKASVSPHGREKRKNIINKVIDRTGNLFLFGNLFAEEWYRQTMAWYYKRRGYVVLFDRHFALEFLAFEGGLSKRHADVLTRLHASFLKNIYPKPDLTIYLDCPAEVLYARKRERSVAQLEKWRQGYLKLKSKIKNFIVVDANRPVEEVVSEVSRVIGCYHLRRLKGKAYRPIRSRKDIALKSAQHKHKRE